MPSGATFNDPDDGDLPAGETALTRQALQAGRLKGIAQAEGIVMIVLGLLALLFPYVASAGVTVMVAVAFLVAGLMGWIDTWSRRVRLNGWHGFLRLILASLFLVTGLWMLLQFKAGIVPASIQIKALALAVGVVFLIEGVLMSVLALSHRQARGWGWGLANGLVTLVLGLLILTMGSAGLLSVLGLLVGISFLFSGFDLLGFSARLHSPGPLPPGSSD
ncbi:MAG: HdeD family acid-resistance protein [Cyanobacteriota bacterium]